MKKDRQKADIFMPLYIGDYIADTMELDAESHGAYLLLLMTAWRRGGRLPTDQVQLAGAARVKPKRWSQVWGMIARFFEVDGDMLVQRRLLRELEKASGRIEAASQNGKNGAAKRWGGDTKHDGKSIATPSKGDGDPNGPPVAKVVAKNSSSPSPSQSENPSEGVPPKPPGFSGPSDPLTPHGLIVVVQVAVEKAHPEIGLYQRGEWAAKAAREFCDAIPADRRTDALRSEVGRRVNAFAMSTDKRITKGRWLVEDFCRSYNELAQAAATTDATARAVGAIADRVDARYG